MIAEFKKAENNGKQLTKLSYINLLEKGGSLNLTITSQFGKKVFLKIRNFKALLETLGKVWNNP